MAMSLLLYLISKPSGASTFRAPCPRSPNKERKRLHKNPRRKVDLKSFYACKELFDVVQQAETCLNLLADDGASLIDYGKGKRAPHLGHLLRHLPPKPSESSMSHYSKESTDSVKMRRAKTPVFYVGQLENTRKSFDHTQALADQYRASLPPRPFTPAWDHNLEKSNRRSLRKIKCQQSLRDLMKEHSRSTSYSDCDTLVGSDVSESPTSPTQNFAEIQMPQKLHLPDKVSKCSSSPEKPILDPAIEDDVGLHICTNLLTNELASALFRQHPSEKQDRASALQILLMIEAYESMQQNIRRELYESQVTGHKIDSHVKYVDGILDQWLEALYVVYDRAERKKNYETIKEEDGEEDWSRRQSEDSQATCVGVA